MCEHISQAPAQQILVCIVQSSLVCRSSTSVPLLSDRSICSSSGAAQMQALTLDTVGKIVKLAGPASIRPHLPDLATALLESLSGLEVRQL